MSQITPWVDQPLPEPCQCGIWDESDCPNYHADDELPFRYEVSGGDQYDTMANLIGDLEDLYDGAECWDGCVITDMATGAWMPVEDFIRAYC